MFTFQHDNMTTRPQVESKVVATTVFSWPSFHTHTTMKKHVALRCLHCRPAGLRCWLLESKPGQGTCKFPTNPPRSHVLRRKRSRRKNEEDVPTNLVLGQSCETWMDLLRYGSPWKTDALKPRRHHQLRPRLCWPSHSVCCEKIRHAVDSFENAQHRL